MLKVAAPAIYIIPPCNELIGTMKHGTGFARWSVPENERIISSTERDIT